MTVALPAFRVGGSWFVIGYSSNHLLYRKYEIPVHLFPGRENMTIIVSKDGKETRVVKRSTIEKEEYLQEYIHDNPESIPIYEIKEDRELLIVAREYPTNSGPIDALAVDREGDIYIVETKLYKNTDKRTVVAQALDYGASLWKHSHDFNEFISGIEKQIRVKFGMDFPEKASEFFGLDENQVEYFMENIRRNLNEGNLKFIIMMDTMDERLKDLIIFVNQNSQFDIYAVELDNYRFDEYEIMIPRIFGVEVKKKVTSSGTSGSRRKWNEESFISHVKNTLGRRADQLLDLYEFSKTHSDSISWGTGNQRGSFTPVFQNIHNSISPFSFFSDEKIRVKFSWFVKVIEKKRLERMILSFHEYLTGDAKEKCSIEDIGNESSMIYMVPGDFIDNYESIKKIMLKLKEL